MTQGLLMLIAGIVGAVCSFIGMVIWKVYLHKRRKELFHKLSKEYDI